MPFDLLGHQKASTYLKEVLNSILLLIPTLILLHFGYIQPSDPFSILNYQLILFALPFAAFFFIIFLTYATLLIYQSEQNKEKKKERRKTYLRFRGWFYGLGGVFWEYVSHIIYGVLAPLMLISAILYLKRKDLSKPKEIPLREWIVGIFFYPLLFLIAYKLVETGLLQVLLVLGPVSFSGFLKSWGDYMHFQSFPAVSSMKKTAEHTYANYNMDTKGNEFLSSLFAYDKSMRHSLYAGINYASKEHTKTELNSLYLDYFRIENFSKQELSFLMPENNSRSVSIEVMEEKPISGNDSLFASVCRFIYAVEFPPYESISLTANGNRMDFMRSHTNYRLVVTEEEPI